MKQLHRPEFFSWSQFDESRNIDFHGLCFQRPEGSVLVDPVPPSVHDLAHIKKLGPTAWILITNSDHTRAAQSLAHTLGAPLAGPAAERDSFPFPCDRWLADGDQLLPGLHVHALPGSKTPGELALSIDGHTLVAGDLIRAHAAGRLNLLPDAKLTDKPAALAALRHLYKQLPHLEAILVGDGWPIFRDGHRIFKELLDSVG